MKKTILTVLSMIILSCCYGQINAVDLSTEYIGGMPDTKGMKGKYRALIDYGQEQVKKNDERTLVDNEGKVIEFNSIVGILNYFSEKGWSYVLSKSEPSSTKHTWYILKKS